MSDTSKQLLEAWHTNNRIHRLLIDRVSDEGLRSTLSKRGGRNVVRQLTHVHNIRVWHLEKRALDLAEGLHRFGTHDEPDRETLKRHLDASSEAVGTFLEQCLAGERKASGREPSPTWPTSSPTRATTAAASS